MQLFSAEPLSGGSAQFFQGVVVIELNRLGQDDRSKNMLVAIMLNLFYEHMLRIPKRPYRGESPQLRTIDSFLLVDEADNIMRFEFDVLRKLLLQGREFGVGVILASQYLRHFKTGGTDYREPLLTWFVHKVPSLVPQELQALGLTSDLQELVERVKTLPNHHCLFKTVGAAGEILNGLPFYRLMSRTT
jgi:DNA phosphorothioation-dependent restriction protein DptH